MMGRNGDMGDLLPMVHFVFLLLGGEKNSYYPSASLLCKTGVALIH